MSLERSEIVENAKLEFAILVEEISLNRSKARLPRRQIDNFILNLPKDIENSIFRFRANRGPFLVASNIFFWRCRKSRFSSYEIAFLEVTKRHGNPESGIPVVFCSIS